MDAPDGAIVADVFKNTPAEKAGLKAGDIILEVDGKDIESVNQLRNTVALLGAGENTTLTVLRDGKEIDVRVKLAERSEDMDLSAVTGEGEESIDGLRIAEINRTNRAKYDIPGEIGSGIVVTGVDPESSAAEVDIREGDVIREIGNLEVNSVDGFIREYKNTNGNVLLYVYRDGRNFFRVLKK
jgi:serine protease Do